jgi:hypothetical protein
VTVIATCFWCSYGSHSHPGRRRTDKRRLWK